MNDTKFNIERVCVIGIGGVGGFFGGKIAQYLESNSIETPEILLFKEMYDNSDRNPFLVSEASIDSISTGMDENEYPIVNIIKSNPVSSRRYI